MQPQPYRARYVPLRALNVGRDVLMVDSEPQAVVDEVGVLLSDALLETHLLLGQGHLLQAIVRPQKRHRRRRLVYLPRLDAHQPILHMVDAAHAVLTGQLVQAAYQRHGIELAAVQGHRHPLLEADLYVARLVGRIGHRFRPLEHVLRRLDPGVLQDAALDAAPPQVLVSGVGALLGHRHGDLVLLSIDDLLVARQPPLPQGGNDAQVGRQRLNADVEAHLVVPLAGRAVGDGGGPLLAGGLHQQLGDKRPPEGGGQRVLLLVDGASGQGGEGEVTDERLLGLGPAESDAPRR